MDEPAPPHAEPPAGTSHHLVAAHLPLVRAIASRLYRLRWNATVDFDDYYQMGALGLVEAANRFDPARGVQFGSFASWRISGAILNGLARSTEQLQQAAHRRERVGARIESLAGHEEAVPADGSVEASLARISKLAIGLAVGFMLEDTGMYQDEEPAHRLDGYASIALRQWRDRLRNAVQLLPAQDREVMKRHYFQHQPFSEIADELGLTRGRISQIHKGALERLRERLSQDNAAFEA